ncbi:ABC1 kinase family protein [Lutimonas sp.]|uniref:ABC1 kinase family protein n=1 Tax=Lutimonas sp. TaxID=1872403 RepID=UPI003D9B38DB
MSFNSNILKTTRFQEIIATLAKYGLADWLQNANIESINGYLKNSSGKDLRKYSKEVRVRMAFGELGTTFIKFGQILSTRSDLIGPVMAEELSLLQSDTKADGIAKVRSKIKKEFGVKKIDEVFASFTTKPIASASIAQVHKATLHSGQEVVVKVMHEGIESKVHEDLKILAKLAKLAQLHVGSLKYAQPELLVKLFSQTMIDELDFNKELQNIQTFRKNFSTNDKVEFPEVFTEQSGKSVLTMSFLKGPSLKKVKDLDWTPEQKSQFAEESAGVFMDMMFRDSFYHADPHPGNLLIQEGEKLGIIDCGMVNKLDAKSQKIFEELIIGVAEKDAEHIKNTILGMCTFPKGTDYDTLTFQIDEFINRFLNLPLNQFDMTAAIKEVTAIIQEHHITIPPNMSNLLRVVVLLEGSSRLLNPAFNIAVLFEKYQIKIMQRRYAPHVVIKKITKNLHQWEHIAETLPKAIDKAIHKISSDNFQINMEHRNLEKSVNRIVMALISAALFLGSSLLMAFKVPPAIDGNSIIGIIGILSASILSFVLIRDIQKETKGS